MIEKGTSEMIEKSSPQVLGAGSSPETGSASSRRSRDRGEDSFGAFEFECALDISNYLVASDSPGREILPGGYSVKYRQEFKPRGKGVSMR